MIVLSGSLSLPATSAAGDLNADSPVVGYDNCVALGGIATTTEDPSFPASNMANPATYSKWRAIDNGSPLSGNDEYITITTNRSTAIDYVALARHNLGSAALPVSVEGKPPGGAFSVIVSETTLTDDGPAIFRFVPQVLEQVRVRIRPGDLLPTVAVAYAGLLLSLQRRIYVGHTPLPYGRSAKITNGRSESGEFLGRIVLGESVATSISLKNLTPAWYRSYFDPFLLAAIEAPFFVAWRPHSYPDETGYAWLTNDPQPSNLLSNGMMGVTLQLAGIST